MSGLTACRLLAGGTVGLLATGGVLLVADLSAWYGWALLVTAALWGVLTWLACAEYRASEWERRASERAAQRLLGAADTMVARNVVVFPSAEELAREWEVFDRGDG